MSLKEGTDDDAWQILPELRPLDRKASIVLCPEPQLLNRKLPEDLRLCGGSLEVKSSEMQLGDRLKQALKVISKILKSTKTQREPVKGG